MNVAQIMGASALAALCGTPLQAQSWTDGLGFEVGASTLGAYVAPSYEFTDRFSLRAPIYFGSVSGDFAVGGNKVAGELNTLSGALIADFKPWPNGVRFSGGLALGGYDGTGTTTNPTFNGTTFSGAVEMRFSQTRQVAPVVSLGYSRAFASGFTLGGDVGAKLVTHAYSGTASNPSQQMALDTEIDRLNGDWEKVPVTPFVSLHLGFRF